jgi:hypothetical protein
MFCSNDYCVKRFVNTASIVPDSSGWEIFKKFSKIFEKLKLKRPLGNWALGLFVDDTISRLMFSLLTQNIFAISISWGVYYKSFYGCNLKISVIS